jgi:hypothetical protein
MASQVDRLLHVSIPTVCRNGHLVGISLSPDLVDYLYILIALVDCCLSTFTTLSVNMYTPVIHSRARQLVSELEWRNYISPQVANHLDSAVLEFRKWSSRHGLQLRDLDRHFSTIAKVLVVAWVIDRWLAPAWRHVWARGIFGSISAIFGAIRDVSLYSCSHGIWDQLTTSSLSADSSLFHSWLVKSKLSCLTFERTYRPKLRQRPFLLESISPPYGHYPRKEGIGHGSRQSGRISRCWKGGMWIVGVSAEQSTM